jgi:hypothetical protein
MNDEGCGGEKRSMSPEEEAREVFFYVSLEGLESYPTTGPMATV